MKKEDLKTGFYIVRTNDSPAPATLLPSTVDPFLENMWPADISEPLNPQGKVRCHFSSTKSPTFWLCGTWCLCFYLGPDAECAKTVP